MKQSQQSTSERTEVIYSPSLYLGRVAVSDHGRARGGLLSGTRLKAMVFPVLHWLIRHTPVWMALLPARLVTALLRGYYLWPANRLRRACEAIAALNPAAAGGIAPRRVHARFLDNALGVLDGFFTLYRRGTGAVLPRMGMNPVDVETLQRLIATHGGAVLAVPHNIGSAFSALRIGHTFDMLLVAKNSPTPARTRIALDFYERMKLSVLMVRGGNPFELSRTMFSVLRQGKLVAATLDNMDNSANSVPVRMFGRQVGLAGWAARIAARMQVPIVPAWFQSSGRELRVIIGEPLITGDIEAAVQHYARFFEERILADPASWAYLADKHWQQQLAAAAGERQGNAQACSS
jgi:Bacterial lipid A biosynthesis acyltransferase